MASAKKISPPPRWRQHLVLTVMSAVFAVLGGRVIWLQVQDNSMLQAQGDKRYLRSVHIAPQRGKILDRNGQVLSVSTPVDSLAADPKLFCKAADLWLQMPSMVGLSKDRLIEKCERAKHSDFMYIQRRLPPHLVAEIMDMKISGVYVKREHKRYFPGGPVGAHLIGFTDSNGKGQEGLELAYNGELSGRAGKGRVLKAGTGGFVESVESIQQVRDGSDLHISIDQRVSSLASQYLDAAVQKHQAAGGSVVVVAIPSGEIISMVNSPQFNPNDRSTFKSGVVRNRAVTDVLEPGSTVKPFTIAMALESGDVTPESMVDTSPGYYQIGRHKVSDGRDHGEISVFDVIVRSSNVGAAKLALNYPYDDLYNLFSDVGFGKKALDWGIAAQGSEVIRPACASDNLQKWILRAACASNTQYTKSPVAMDHEQISSRQRALPGEVNGALKKRTRKIEHATLSFGYGLSVTMLQLARAYTVFATDGELLPMTYAKKAPGYKAKGTRILQPETVAHIRAMLEQVATSQGTAAAARIPRYRIGGKTGTSRKLIDGNYADKRYISLFAGLAPITNPKFVMVVSIDDPRGQFYYGGDVAAPVFSNLMADLMRLYNVKPDALEGQIAALTGLGG